MARLEEELAALATMSPAQLRQEWSRLHRTPPPNFTADLLARGIAYFLQERYLGRMCAATRRELDRLVRRRADADSAPTVRLKPGSRLAREWHGRTHHVLILDEGYLYDDRRYDSLSAIAREITGAAWSGPRFFGVRQKAGTR
jgi:hypothetical protein